MSTFDEFCTSLGIDIQFLVPDVHFQNGIAGAVIKRLQDIARPFIMHLQLPDSAWGHAILHANAPIQYRPSAFNTFSPYQMNNGMPPDLLHLRSFGYQVMVPITPPKWTKTPMTARNICQI